MKFGLLAITVGGGAVIALVVWFGARSISADVWHAGWVIPFTSALLFVQLYLSAIAWRISIGEDRPGISRYFRIRWIREAVNSMLPVAQLGGNLVGIRLLVQRGVSGQLAGAGTTLDLTIEAGTQFLFTIAGFIVLLANGSREAWSGWLIWAMVTMALGLAGFVIAQRVGLLRLVEWLATRLRAIFPSISVEGVRGVHAELMRLQRDWPALARAAALHSLAWVLGTIETWLALTAMGRPTALAEAFVIESLGMAARSAGFAVPGALGIQEAGFIVVCALFGINADFAIALSMLKRVRELVIGVPGLVLWQWAEGKQLLRRRSKA